MQAWRRSHERAGQYISGADRKYSSAAPGSVCGASAGDVLLGKAEWANPGGSVKDRAASAIVAAAEAKGLLAGRHLLDATSGNTGIAYAMLGAAKGFPVTLCMPSNVSPGAEADSRRLRGQRCLDGSGRRVRRSDHAKRASWRGTRTGTITPTNTATRRTGRRIITAPRTRSGSRPRGRSPTSWPGWAPAARSWAPPGG